ncbi:Uncharacterised protein [Bordetella pertussis]|nr:Uncharacterised protein [Bordetella pertussis]CFN60815.1 Uncharacterised protein [Bordetella pertussis]CFN66561.1 Uncharacterised protein [Bordetella pertussis]CFN82286.1 Uncharacterised protein [Bordetella pertussis]CFO06503.1 Uncharacterised protein [Bordetella pertussis]
MATRSCARICVTSWRRADLSSGSLARSAIEPEVSISSTRLTAGISCGATRYPWMPTSSSWRCGFQGAGAISVVREKGTAGVAGAG